MKAHSRDEMIKKKETKWHGIRLTSGLIQEIDQLLKDHPRWRSRADFCQDAVRRLLDYYRELEKKK